MTEPPHRPLLGAGRRTAPPRSTVQRPGPAAGDAV